MRLLSLLLILMITIPCKAIECQWWEVKIRAQIIPEHSRNDIRVKQHIRQEHCREKWKGSKELIPFFKNNIPPSWPNKVEKFKEWNTDEISKVLDIYVKLPGWLVPSSISFYRARVSKIPTNIASIDVMTNTITFYDLSFVKENYANALKHELAHILFKQLNVKELNTVSDLSGWSIRIKITKFMKTLQKNSLEEILTLARKRISQIL